ncbi:MAG TPA: four-helix bundle copper-binding protein [Solirubrobacteraceae bacterium]|nr:four-helix bundle copper-binding protein [Solirubrobacteraceae bacterium]
MTDTKDMIGTGPGGVPLGTEAVAAAIDACLRCVQSCTSCAAADLVEDDVAEMRACIARCLNCADICNAVARLLSRPTASEPAVIHPLLQACVRACASSAEECARHAQHHVHCALCEQACRACVEACTALLGAEAFAALR